MPSQDKILHECDKRVITLMSDITSIYKNKSSDEYKMCGDITKSPCYSKIELMLADLSTIRNFKKNDIDDLRAVFNVLHRPIFKQMSAKFIQEPDQTNVVIASVFVAGYRVLVGELSRIYASTEATETGFIYYPPKLTKQREYTQFINAFKNNIEEKINSYVRESNKNKTTVHQEAVSIKGLIDTITGNGPVGMALDLITKGTSKLFNQFTQLNPVAFIDQLLTNSYDNKVKSFNDAVDMYEATKQAYDEYMRIPQAQRKRKIEHRYVRLMKKYNIRMKNLQAKIAHYDQRAIEEARENMDHINIPNTNTSSSNTTTATNDDFDF